MAGEIEQADGFCPGEVVRVRAYRVLNACLREFQPQSYVKARALERIRDTTGVVERVFKRHLLVFAVPDDQRLFGRPKQRSRALGE